MSDSFVVDATSRADVVWLIEVNPLEAAMPTFYPFHEMAGGHPMMAPEVISAPVVPVVRINFSDKGWIARPDDPSGANLPYYPKMQEPPGFIRQIPIYPGGTRRAEINDAELKIVNNDDTSSGLIGDWSLVGAKVVVYRGPHLRPIPALKSQFTRFGEFRIGQPGEGFGVISIPLRNLSVDLTMKVCPTFAGTGGEEGPANAKGVSKQQVYGEEPNLELQLVDGALGIYLASYGGADAIVEVRDIGLPITFQADYASYAALAAAVIPAGQYGTCLATGHVRVNETPTLLTATVRGVKTFGGWNGISSRIAVQLLRGPAGLGADRADEANFADWPQVVCTLVIRDETVEEALDKLAAGLNCYWGADENGVYRGKKLVGPEHLTPVYTLDERVIIEPPQNVAQPRPPWWRASVGVNPIDRVQEASDLSELPAITADLRQFYAKKSRTEADFNSTTQLLYPGPASEDGEELPAVVRYAADGLAIASGMLSLYGTPRRAWSVKIRTKDWHIFPPGSCVYLSWKGISSLKATGASAKRFIVQQISTAGDEAEVVLWG